MAFPPAHLLVGAGAAEVARAFAPVPPWRARAVAAFLAVLPDADIVLGIALGRGGLYHGTFTHSLVATLVVALVAAALAGWRWALVAGLGYGSHLLVDLLDDRGRTNVLLGWPFTHERPFAIGRVFPQVTFDHGEGVPGAVLSLFTAEAMGSILHQTLVGLLFYLALYGLGAGIRQLRARRRVV